MKLKIYKIQIMSFFLLMSLLISQVSGIKTYDNENQKTGIRNNNHYSNTLYNIPFNKYDVEAVTRWTFEDDTLTHSGERNVFIDNISTGDIIDDFEDGRLDTPMPWYGNTEELSIDDNSQVYEIYSAKLHSKSSFKEVNRDFENPLTGDGTKFFASIKIDRQNPGWRGDHVDIVLDENEGTGDHEILCVKFMDNSGIFEYQYPNQKIFDYWLTGIVYDVIIELDFTHQTANITVEFEWNGHPPEKPIKPQGSTNGEIGEEYTYTTSTTDPDGDQIYYIWDWGEGSPGTYSWGVGPFNSGETADANHIWDKKGSYSIRVKAVDEYGAQSEWSDPLSVIMPRNILFKTIFMKILERFPHVFPIIRHLIGL